MAHHDVEMAARAAADEIWPVAGDPASQGGTNADPRQDPQSGWSAARDGFLAGVTQVDIGLPEDELDDASTAWAAGFRAGQDWATQNPA